jgi:phosphoesterase RecJ-like protein
MFDSVNRYLAAARQVLLISHMGPDGDAIGSLLGLKWLLQAQQIEVIAANPDGVPPFLRFLPGWDTVVPSISYPGPDLVIALDSSDVHRLGKLYPPDSCDSLPVINIDHHVTNQHFGVLNLVDTAATSTCEVIYRLARSEHWPIDARAAQCLLAGIVGDTMGFRTANVSPPVLAITQDLMDAGASLALVNDNLFHRSSLASICLWGKALSSARLADRIIWTVLPVTYREECHGIEQSDTGLASFLVAAQEADVAVVFSQRQDGAVDIGLRAIPGVDVSHVALNLGGGGHAQAAGCTLWLSLDEAEQVVLAALRDALAAQSRVPVAD